MNSIPCTILARLGETCGLVGLVPLLLVVWSGSADADWLLHHAPCGAGSEPPAFAIQYPARGLPAVVEAGGVLEARVTVPVPLTPPPGRQQAAALLPWSARLLVRLPLAFTASVAGLEPPAVPTEWLVYPLPVVDLRPEDGASLRYRLRLPVPAWVAPGAYALELRGPGGLDRAQGPVVVKAKGTPLRIAGWASPGARRPAPPDLRLTRQSAVAGSPVAAVEDRASDGALDGVLDGGVPALVVHPAARGDVWVLQPWAARPAVIVGPLGERAAGALADGFSALARTCGPDVAKVLRGYGADSMAGTGITFAPAVPSGVGAGPWSPPRVETGAVARVHNRAQGIRRVRLLIPATATGVATTGALDARFYPAGEWHGTAPRHLVLGLDLAGGAVAEVRPRQPRAVPVSRTARTHVLTAGEPGRLPLPAWAPPTARESFAMRWSASDTHMGPGGPTVQLQATGVRVVSALAIGPQGQVRLVAIRLVVLPGGRGAHQPGPQQLGPQLGENPAATWNSAPAEAR